MKEILKGSFKLFGKYIIANFLSFFIVISISTLTVAIFSDVTGYYVTATKDKEVVSYTHYIKDGEDVKLQEYENKGYEVNKQKIREVSEKGDIASNIIIQIFNLVVLFCLVYPYLWNRGYRERNLVLTGNQAPSSMKGLITGMIASVPAFLFLVVSALTEFSVAVFKMLNALYYPLIEFVVGDATSFATLKAWQLLLMALWLLIMPAVAFLGYYLGYKDFSIWEKIIYRKAK